MAQFACVMLPVEARNVLLIGTLNRHAKFTQAVGCERNAMSAPRISMIVTAVGFTLIVAALDAATPTAPSCPSAKSVESLFALCIQRQMIE